MSSSLDVPCTLCIAQFLAGSHFLELSSWKSKNGGALILLVVTSYFTGGHLSPLVTKRSLF
jgi:hypothetical protein